MSTATIEKSFPQLIATSYQITSPPTAQYNCIAWAAGDSRLWWWPDQMNLYYWPPSIPRQETVPAFVQAYGLLGYVPCNNAMLEHGFEKVALYANRQGTPTHAARQLPSGRWTSKLGRSEDIDHEQLEHLSTYGQITIILKRPNPLF